jgi:hypothetical protein
MHYRSYKELKKKHLELKKSKFENWEIERERRKIMGTRYQVRPDAFSDLKTSGSIYAAQVYGNDYYYFNFFVFVFYSTC